MDDYLGNQYPLDTWEFYMSEHSIILTRITCCQNIILSILVLIEDTCFGILKPHIADYISGIEGVYIHKWNYNHLMEVTTNPVEICMKELKVIMIWKEGLQFIQSIE